MHALTALKGAELEVSLAASSDLKVAKLLYSRRDAAFALSISVRSLDYLIANQKLPVRKIGKKVLVPAGSLTSFAAMDHECLTQHPYDSCDGPLM